MLPGLLIGPSVLSGCVVKLVLILFDLVASYAERKYVHSPVTASYTPFNSADVWHKDGYKYIHPVSTGGTTVPTNLTQFDRFQMLYKVREPQYWKDDVHDSLSSITNSKFNGLPMALTLPQGSGQGQRQGASVKVLKDRFTFKVAIPYTNLNASIHTAHLSQRTFNIRMVGIFVGKFREAGNPGQDFQPSEVFVDPTRISSAFKKQGAFGYKKIFDKTKTIVPEPCVVANDNLVNGTTRNFRANRNWTFTFDVGSYIRRYTNADTLGNPLTDYDTDPESQTGLRSGEVIWYVCVSDPQPPINLVVTSGEPPVVTQPYKRLHPSNGFLVYVKRDTVYIDS